LFLIVFFQSCLLNWLLVRVCSSSSSRSLFCFVIFFLLLLLTFRHLPISFLQNGLNKTISLTYVFFIFHSFSFLKILLIQSYVIFRHSVTFWVLLTFTTHIVMIDSITSSFCIHHHVQNGISYLGKETRPKLCRNDAKLRSGILDLERNKHQLLHRIASVKTPLTYNKTSGGHRSSFIVISSRLIYNTQHFTDLKKLNFVKFDYPTMYTVDLF